MLSPQLRARFFRILVLLVGLTLLWFVFKNVDAALLWAALRHAHLGLIALSVAATFLTYLIRTWRWMALLKPIGSPGFRTAFRATVMGFTALIVLGRVGEFLRPYWLARRENFAFAPTLATIIVERVLDVVAVLALFTVFAMTTDVGAMGTVFQPVKLGGEIAAAGSLVALVVMFLSAGHPERLGRWAAALVRVLPPRVGTLVSTFVQTFAEGLAIMRRPAALITATVLSIPLWLSIALGIWFASSAFDLTISYTGTFLIMMFLVVGVAIPIPGNVGTFEAFYNLAVTQFFAAPAAPAAAAALTLHVVSSVPVCLIGLIFMAQDGLTLTGLRDIEKAHD
jgi:glycosyltransferase 2 family protein